MTLGGFTEDQIERYGRHIALPEIGGKGQRALNQAAVLVVGAGGLGSPVIQYLAAAGVGRLTLCDPQAVERSNLQRQVIHRDSDVGVNKATSAQRFAQALNPDIAVAARDEAVTAENAADLVAGHDLVVDGTDLFAARYLLSDACHLYRRPLVTAAILRFDGQITTLHSFDGAGPCFRCLHPEPPPDDSLPSCAQAGILGALPGMLGSMQAVEAIKLLAGTGTSLVGRLVLVDTLDWRWEPMAVSRDPACPTCGDAPTITDLSPHAHARAGG